MIGCLLLPHVWTHAGSENCRSNRCAHTSHTDGDEATSLLVMPGIRRKHRHSAWKRARFRAGLFSSPSFLPSGIASSAGLARDLAQIVSEPIFDIPRLMETARHQRFDPILGGGSPERSNARIPPGAELDVRRQAGVDKALRVGDGPFVELGDPSRKCLYERVQIGVGDGAIHVAVGFGLV